MERHPSPVTAGDPATVGRLLVAMHVIFLGAVGVALVLATAGVLPGGPLAAQRPMIVPVVAAVWVGFHWWWLVRRGSAEPRRWVVYLVVSLGLWAVGLAADHGVVVMALPLLAVALVAVPRDRIAPSVLGVAGVMAVGELLVGNGLGHAVAVVGLTTAAGLAVGLPVRAVIEQSLERRRLIRELEATRSELAAAERAAGADDERDRIAREIHDSLAQTFTSVIVLLEAAEDLFTDGHPARAHLERAIAAARDGLAEARRVVRAEQPGALEGASLSAALERLGDRFAEETGLTSRVETTLRSGCPTDVEVTLLRAAQEALTNVRRHADATDVEIELHERGGRAHLCVRDDGRGFDPDAIDGGLGLRGMRERAGALGGSVRVASAVGRGTEIRVSVPLTTRAAGPATVPPDREPS